MVDCFRQYVWMWCGQLSEEANVQLENWGVTVTWMVILAVVVGVMAAIYMIGKRLIKKTK